MLWAKSGERAHGCPLDPQPKRNGHGTRLANTLQLRGSARFRSHRSAVAIALPTTGGFGSAIWTTDLCKSPRQKSLWRHMTTEKE